mmetsp:Transcript_3454/g.10565  ORF Transcript_3454/g.10565 Transcript_3454/m.10565 type:complete len:180 (-) Transcript_3454:280-819(-)
MRSWMRSVTSLKAWLSLSMLWRTSALMRSSAFVPPQMSLLSKVAKTQVFQTVSRRVPALLKKSKPVVLATAEPVLQAEPQLSTTFPVPTTMVPVPTSVVPIPPPLAATTRRTRPDYAPREQSGLGVATRWLSEAFTQLLGHDDPVDAIIVTKKHNTMKKYNTQVPIVIMERDHVVILRQ